MIGNSQKYAFEIILPVVSSLEYRAITVEKRYNHVYIYVILYGTYIYEKNNIVIEILRSRMAP